MAPAQQSGRQRGQNLWRWFLLAALLHLEALLVIGVVVYFQAPRDADLAAEIARRAAESLDTVELTTLDDETSRKIVAELEREKEKAEEEQIKKEVEAKEAPGQVVELPKPREEKRPDNAKFAAEHDSSVEKEKKKYGKFDERARQGDKSGEDEQNMKAAPPAPPTQAAAPTPPSPNKSQSKPAPQLLAMRTPGAPGRPPGPDSPGVPGQQGGTGVSGEQLAAPSETGGELGQVGQFMPRLPGGGGAPPSPRVAPAPQASQAQAPALQPSQQQIARAIGSGTQDYLKDIDEGDETALNSKKWKHASFFNRVKQQVREHWRPADAYRRRDPTGAIYGNKDRYTLVRVQLKPDGSLANVALEMPSGIEFLDDEAIEAFKEAQPFPNPPKQLQEAANGMINFRFGFFFEIGGSPRMKIFRYNSM
jgi:TonB family protein